MITNILECGNKLELIVQDFGLTESGLDVDHEKTYLSLIYDLPDEEKIIATIPSEKGKLILMPIGTTVMVVSYTKNGLYCCNATIKERYKTGSTFLMSLEVKSNLSKYQRRDYYRWDCLLDLDFRVLPKDIELNEVDQNNLDFYLNNCQDNQIRQGTIVDISGGGMRFVSNCQTEENNILLLSFVLESTSVYYEPILLGRLLHCVKTDNTGIFENRLQFQEISSFDREIIVKYIFEEERKSRKFKKRG